MKLAIMWFRRDLRIEDNTALQHALNSGFSVLPIFMFDSNILQELPRDDARVFFIFTNLKALNYQFMQHGSALQFFMETLYSFGKP